MKNYLSTTIKSLIITTIFVAGVSVAFAFTIPGTPPSPNVSVPITTGTDNQTKIGGIAEKFLLAGSGLSTQVTTSTSDSFLFAKTLMGAPYGLFSGDGSLVSGTDSHVKIGSSGITSPLIPSQYTTPLTIDLVGRGDDYHGRNADELLSGSSCTDKVSVLTDAGAVRFVDNSSPTANDDDSHTVDVIGRQVRLSGGNAGALKVLVATDTQGDAVWGTLSIVNGAVKVNYQASPVASSQICSTPVVVSGCMNPAASNYNPNATVDNGSCIANAYWCHSGRWLSATSMVPAGYCGAGEYMPAGQYTDGMAVCQVSAPDATRCTLNPQSGSTIAPGCDLNNDTCPQ